MKKFQVEIGKRYARLIVLEELPIKSGQVMVRCVCDCGNEKVSRFGSIRAGEIKSCGCLQKEMGGLLNKTHGKSNSSRLYTIWKNMRQRCNNPNADKGKRYGNRGISICKGWDSFVTFEEWAIDNRYQEHLTIDRINNDGNYEPSNCRWATQFEQLDNTSTNRNFKAIAPSGKVYFAHNQAEFARTHVLQAQNINKVLGGHHSIHKGWYFEYV